MGTSNVPAGGAAVIPGNAITNVATTPTPVAAPTLSSQPSTATGNGSGSTTSPAPTPSVTNNPSQTATPVAMAANSNTVQFVAGTVTQTQVASINGNVSVYFPETETIGQTASATVAGFSSVPSSLPAIPSARNYGALIRISNASMTVPFSDSFSGMTLNWIPANALTVGSSWQTAWYNPQSSSSWTIERSYLPATYYTYQNGIYSNLLQLGSSVLGGATLNPGETIYIAIYN